jgi:hypothetical protein
MAIAIGAHGGEISDTLFAACGSPKVENGQGTLLQEIAISRTYSRLNFTANDASTSTGIGAAFEAGHVVTNEAQVFLRSNEFNPSRTLEPSRAIPSNLFVKTPPFESTKIFTESKKHGISAKADDNGLPPAAIVGIVLGPLALIAALAALWFFVFRTRGEDGEDFSLRKPSEQNLRVPKVLHDAILSE